MDDRVTNPESKEWAEAHKRLKDRREFGTHVVTYIAVSLFSVLTWAMSGAGYFWPGWMIGAWGLSLVLQGWHTFKGRPVTDADIEAELQRRA